METIEREHKKVIPLAVIQIMEEYTDDKHALEMSELKEILKHKYGINADRRTLYTTMKLIKEFGYDINYGHPYKGSLKRGYYLVSRELSEDDCIDALKAVRHEEDFRDIKESLLKHFSQYQKVNIEYSLTGK